MSAPLAVDDVLQITIAYVVSQQQCRAVLHYRVQTPGSGTSAESQLQAIADFLTGTTGFPFPLLTKLKSAVTTTVYFDWLTVQKVKPARTIYARSEIDDFGILAGSTAPPNVAASFEKRSTKAGRRGVGRLQLAGMPRDDVGAQLSDTWMTVQGKAIADEMMGALTITTSGSLSLRPCLPGGGTDHEFDLWDVIQMGSTRTMHRRTLGLGI